MYNISLSQQPENVIQPDHSNNNLNSQSVIPERMTVYRSRDIIPRFQEMQRRRLNSEKELF